MVCMDQRNWEVWANWETYTGATEVSGPGSVERVGKGANLQACSTS